MRLHNLITCAELRSEDHFESAELLKASMRSYSPRSVGVSPNDYRMLVIQTEECFEFVRGIMSDVDISPRTKWAISKLISEWCLNNIKDEAIA